MGEFFRPWRRKIGVVTLAMACVFAAGWVRSNSVEDLEDVLRVSISKRQTTTFKSRNGTICWADFDKPEAIAGIGSAVISDHFGPSESTPASPEWQRSWFGISFGQQCDPYDGTRIRFCNIPHWSIVTPLTLISAYLLLSKPRSSNRTHAEPVPEKVA